jgi:hypothetical protein
MGKFNVQFGSVQAKGWNPAAGLAWDRSAERAALLALPAWFSWNPLLPCSRENWTHESYNAFCLKVSLRNLQPWGLQSWGM